MRFALKARRQCCWRLRIVYPHLLCTLIPARHVFSTCDARCNSVSDQYSCYPQVTGMLDESKGTLRLARDGLGDARVPSLPLETLKDMYRTGRGSVCSWRATASSANRGTCPTSCLSCFVTFLIDVLLKPQGRCFPLGVESAICSDFEYAKH